MNRPADSTPRISVVVYSYNFERYIAECLESVLAQTLPPWEIVVCDDCSTDRSWQIIEDYRRRRPDIFRTFRHEHNIGSANNGIFGKRQAQGRLVTLLDGDDRFLPRKLELEWEALRRNPQARIAYSDVFTIDESGWRTGRWGGDGWQPPQGDVFIPVFAKRFFPESASVFRNQLMCREILDEEGYDDPEIPLHLDWDLKIRLTAKCRVAYSGSPQLEYRVHNGGFHNRSSDLVVRSLAMVYEKNRHLLDGRTPEEVQLVRESLTSLLRSKVPGAVLPV